MEWQTRTATLKAPTAENNTNRAVSNPAPAPLYDSSKLPLLHKFNGTNGGTLPGQSVVLTTLGSNAGAGAAVVAAPRNVFVAAPPDLGATMPTAILNSAMPSQCVSSTTQQQPPPQPLPTVQFSIAQNSKSVSSVANAPTPICTFPSTAPTTVPQAGQHQLILPAAPTTTTATIPTTTTTTSLGGIAASQASQIFRGMPLRRGKWTPEEERYANRLIEEFENGTVSDCENGCTLRAFLSRKLHCAPMRISKKFAGKSIGKHVFLSRSIGTAFHHPNARNNTKANSLQELEFHFYRSVLNEGNGVVTTANGGKSPFVAINGFHQFMPQFHHPTPPATLHTAPLYQTVVQSAHGTPQTILVGPSPSALSHPGQAFQVPTTISSLNPSIQTGVVAESESTKNAVEAFHAKQLQQSYINAVMKSKQQDEKEAASKAQPETVQQARCDTAKQTEATSVAIAPRVNVTAKNDKNSGPESSSSAVQQESVAKKSGNDPDHAGRRTDFLSGFDNLTSHQFSDSVVSSDGKTKTCKPQTATSDSVPNSPPFTSSKSFDDFHKLLGSDIPAPTAPSTKANVSKTSKSPRKCQNHGPGVTVVSSANYKEGSALAPASSSSPPQPLLGARTPVSADAYALFAQQSVQAVSQHSAYYRNGVVGGWQTSQPCPAPAAPFDSYFTPLVTSQKDSVSQPKVNVVEDEDKTIGGIKFSAANVSAHAKALEDADRKISTSSEIRSEAVHSTNSQRPNLDLGGGVSSVLARSGLGVNNQVVVSGSEKSSSDTGNESETVSAEGSSPELTGGSSGSENLSDNSSDHSENDEVRMTEVSVNSKEPPPHKGAPKKDSSESAVSISATASRVYNVPVTTLVQPSLPNGIVQQQQQQRPTLVKNMIPLQQDVSADAYAFFAQQSARAVSQHSAYSHESQDSMSSVRKNVCNSYNGTTTTTTTTTTTVNPIGSTDIILHKHKRPRT